jgi:hypothetical protein
METARSLRKPSEAQKIIVSTFSRDACKLEINLALGPPWARFRVELSRLRVRLAFQVIKINGLPNPVAAQ